jgi:hypothetical protein
MKTRPTLLLWLVAGALALVVTLRLFSSVFPWVPLGWKTDREEAIVIAGERLRDLAPEVEDGYVVALVDSDTLVERQLTRSSKAAHSPAVHDQRLDAATAHWLVRVYPPGAGAGEWARMARVSMDGEILALRLRLRAEETGETIDPAVARREADAFLTAQAFDHAAFGEPVLRTQSLRSRVDTTLRYPYRESVLPANVPYGVEVTFAGRQLAGFERFLEEPEIEKVRAELQPGALLGMARIMSLLLLLVVVAVPFLKRYHAGEIGVRRGLQVFAFLLALGLVLVIAAGRAIAEGWGLGVLTRQQTTGAVVVQMVLFHFLPLAWVGFLAWSVGESLCRERWGAKLAAFDALFQRDWFNATVARSALRGTALGLLLSAAILALVAFLRRWGVWAPFDLNYGPWWPAVRWPGVGLVITCVLYAVVGELFGRLFLLPILVRRLGLWMGGLLAAVIASVVLFGGLLFLLPTSYTFGLAVLVGGVGVVVFLRYDLLTSMLTAIVSAIASSAAPMVLADDVGLQVQGGLALLFAGLPMLLSLRSLFSGREFVYRYDDVPPHVRRIAERERQRVELETAREIQSSILPDLPSQLNGVELAHLYLPATEVGGDFYDVLALEDGRLAVAVGDVAGHGVSSGLVMSMTRSALAVQTTFDPEVEAVFRTLNRVVFQSARRRLLATLCYALIDPRRREMQFASAGHLFPYRVTAEGGVDSLESVSYPLGVRNPLEIRPRAAKLGSGDTLVMFSDGLIEARAEGSEEQYGFDRLEESLTRHAGKAPGQLRDALLDDVQRFTRGAQREDDLTIVILRMPAAV